MNSPEPTELVAVAVITKPRGVRGEVTARVLTDFPERFEGLERVIIVTDEGVRTELGIERFFFHKDRIVLRLEGVDSYERADLLRNAEVCVPETEAVELEEDEYFDWELEGCLVETVSGERIGTVRGVFRAGENVNLVVADGEREHMIPFVGAICREVDIVNRRIEVDPPEGLLEL